MELLTLFVGQCGDGVFIKRSTFLLFHIAGSERGQILTPSRQECRHHLSIFYIHVQPKLLRNKGIAKITHVLRQPPSMRAKDGTARVLAKHECASASVGSYITP